jgi:hypothetical protein
MHWLRWSLTAGLVLLTVSAWADAEQAADWRSVWVSASQFPANVQNLPLSRLSLARWEKDRFVPVPFQFDEMDQLGLVYFDDELAPLDGRKGVFDGVDELGFMWRDAGAAAPATARPDKGKLLADMAVSLPTLPERHLYLLEDSPARSDRNYVQQDMKTGVTITPRYVLKVDPENELQWHDFRFQGYTGVGSIVDSLRMRMSGHMLAKFAPSITLDNDNLNPRLLASKAGPIRTVMLLKIHVVVLGIPVMSIYEQVSRYAAEYQAITYTHIPALYRASLRNPHVAVSIVGNNLLGATLETALSAGNSVTVDGHMGKEEKNLLTDGIDNRNNWLYFNSSHDFVMVTRLDIPDELRNVPVALVYDDQKGKGNQASLLPNVGYAIYGWPREKELKFGLDLLFDNSLHDVRPASYLMLRTGSPSLLIKAAEGQ